MKHLPSILFLAFCLAVGLTLGLGIRHFRQAPPPPSHTDGKLNGELPAIRGLAMVPETLSSDPGHWPQRAKEIKDLGGTWLGLTADWASARAPTLTALLKPAVAAAHAQGLQVSLRVLVPVSGGQMMRHGPAPADFAPVAANAQASAVDLLAVGYETPFDDEDEIACRNRIAVLRAGYRGKIAAVLHVDTYPYVTWWDAVDYLGVAGPFPISFQPSPTPAQLRLGYEVHVGTIGSLSARYGKPVILFHVAHPATAQAASDPANPTGPANRRDLQAQCLTAALIATKAEPWLAGLFLANFHGQPAPGDPYALDDPAALPVISDQWLKNPAKPPTTKPAATESEGGADFPDFSSLPPLPTLPPLPSSSPAKAK